MGDDLVMGTCSICGGAVTVPKIWMGVVPPTPTCARCGAYAAPPTLPVIPMYRPEPPQFPYQHFYNPLPGEGPIDPLWWMHQVTCG